MKSQKKNDKRKKQHAGARSCDVPARPHAPQHAEDDDGRGQGDEGDAVADGVADLHLLEKLVLMQKGGGKKRLETLER